MGSVWKAKAGVSFDDLKITWKKSQVIQSASYYPFGLQTQDSWTRVDAKPNQFLYTGKELENTTNQYNFGARMYDPALGRWNGVDQLAGKYETGDSEWGVKTGDSELEYTEGSLSCPGSAPGPGYCTLNAGSRSGDPAWTRDETPCTKSQSPGKPVTLSGSNQKAGEPGCPAF